jgi:hypothetical protein
MNKHFDEATTIGQEIESANDELSPQHSIALTRLRSKFSARRHCARHIAASRTPRQRDLIGDGT